MIDVGVMTDTESILMTAEIELETVQREDERDAIVTDLMMNMMGIIQSKTTKVSRRKRARLLCSEVSLSMSQRMISARHSSSCQAHNLWTSA